MPKRQKNNHSPLLKKQVAIKAIKGERTIAQISSEHNIFPARIHEWKKLLLKKGD
jgi:transposase-like protein